MSQNSTPKKSVSRKACKCFPLRQFSRGVRICRKSGGQCTRPCSEQGTTSSRMCEDLFWSRVSGLMALNWKCFALRQTASGCMMSSRHHLDVCWRRSLCLIPTADSQMLSRSVFGQYSVRRVTSVSVPVERQNSKNGPLGEFAGSIMADSTLWCLQWNEGRSITILGMVS